MSAMRAQIWSLDVIVAISAFLIGFALLLYLLTSQIGEGAGVLERDADVLLNALQKGNNDILPVVVDSKVDIRGLVDIYNNYNTTKESLGLFNEFCIYLVDENGAVFTVQYDPDQETLVYGITGENIVSFDAVGKQNVRRDDVFCTLAD